MILAESSEGREAPLAEILPMQRQDFVDLFTIMAGRPVNIRLLDPPLHEFLPQTEQEQAAMAEASGLDLAHIQTRVAELAEVNPMLGHRGCRIGLTYPEIYEMQMRAIIEAAAQVQKNGQDGVKLEIMIPLVADAKELEILAARLTKLADEVMATAGQTVEYQIGTMIELPRAALQAKEIARTAEYFSFGTNDLTQTTFGISRDDAATFLSPYLQKGIIEQDPFVTLDQKGVGALVQIASEAGRETRPDIKLGICGEHGGDPASITFCESLGLDYVSCSPYRVPIARLAAAQAALKKA